ncbi:MAG: spore coat associated protein CotJA [Clostridia bacterium]|nr:spore coat associated protein CotJA [Clostridia bacterium]
MPPQMPCPMVPMPPQMPCPPGGYGMGPSPDFRLAHAYVPWQYYNAVFSPAEALHRGTLFPELCMPQGEYGPCEGPRPCKVYFGGGVPYGCE